MNLAEFIPKAYAATETAATGSDSILGGDTGVKSLSAISSYIFSHLGGWIAGLMIVFIAIIIAKKLGNSARNAIIKSKGEDVPENSLVLVERMTYFFIISIGVVIALAINGLNFTAVIGALSLGIGFALKSFIENFISSVIMLGQNRIRIGDLVDINGNMGHIISIDMRTTVVQLLNGPMVSIPNTTMLASNWTNYTDYNLLRLELMVAVAYDADLAAAVSIIKAVAAKDPDIMPKPVTRVFVDNFGPNTINIKIWFWINVNNPWYEAKSNFAHRIKKAFDKSNIRIEMVSKEIFINTETNEEADVKVMENAKKGYKATENAKHNISKKEMAKLAEETTSEEMIPFDPFEITKPAEPVAVPVTTPPSSLQAKPHTAVPPKHL